MSLVTSFVVFLQPLAVAMTGPSFDNALTILSGWIFASRRTVTNMILAAAAARQKHHSAFHRLFASARWSRDRLGLAVFGMLSPWLGDVVLLALDDTLAQARPEDVRRRHASRSTAFESWQSDHQLGTQLGRAGRDPPLPSVAAAGVLSADFVSLVLEQGCCRPPPPRVSHASRVGRRVADVVVPSRQNGAFSRRCRQRLRRSKRAQPFAGELRFDQPLAAQGATVWATPRAPAGHHRPATQTRGAVADAATDARRARTRVELELYGRRDRVRLTDTLAYVYAAPERPLRVVAVEALAGGRGQQAFYSTCWQAAAIEVLTWYAWRWSIEVAFHDSKQSLGFEDPQGWTRRAVERTAPMAMLLYSLIIAWFVSEGHRYYRPLQRPWYTTKSHPSFADMLATLRRASLRELVSSWGLAGQGCRKVLAILENTAALTA